MTNTHPILVFEPFTDPYDPKIAATLLPSVADWASTQGVQTCAMYYGHGWEVNEPNLRAWLACVPNHIKWGCIDHEQRNGPINAWLSKRADREEQQAATRMIRNYLRICRDVRDDISWGVWGVPARHHADIREIWENIGWLSPPIYDRHLAEGPTGHWSPEHQRNQVSLAVGAAFALALENNVPCIPCTRWRIAPSSSPHGELVSWIPTKEYFNETVNVCLRLPVHGIAVWGKVLRLLLNGDLEREVPEECNWSDRAVAIAHLEYHQAARIAQLLFKMPGGEYVESPFQYPG